MAWLLTWVSHDTLTTLSHHFSQTGSHEGTHLAPRMAVDQNQCDEDSQSLGQFLRPVSLSPCLTPSSTPRLLIQLVPGCLHALAGCGTQTGSSPCPEPVSEDQRRTRAPIGQGGSHALRWHPGTVIPTQGWLVREEWSPTETMEVLSAEAEQG